MLVVQKLLHLHHGNRYLPFASEDLTKHVFTNTKSKQANTFQQSKGGWIVLGKSILITLGNPGELAALFLNSVGFGINLGVAFGVLIDTFEGVGGSFAGSPAQYFVM